MENQTQRPLSGELVLNKRKNEKSYPIPMRKHMIRQEIPII